MENSGLVNCGMGKTPRRTYRPIYLQEWLEAVGAKPADVARAAAVGESYISNIIAGRKENPSAHVLLAISEHLGITVNDLYRRPPPESSLSHLTSLSPAALDALLRGRKG